MFRRGDDLLVTKADGEYVTMFRNEGNSWWNGATTIYDKTD